MKQFVILHNIRSAYNVGAIFRTADGAGVFKIYITGYTPAPIDRFGRAQPEIEKTALGATSNVPWIYEEDIFKIIESLKSEGVEIVAVEQDERAKDYKTFKSTVPTAYILGNEIEGVPKEVCDASDHIIEIKMQGKKESLNVSVVAGIVLFNTQ